MFLTEIFKNLRFISLGRIGNLSRLSYWLQTFWFASLTIILISNLDFALFALIHKTGDYSCSRSQDRALSSLRGLVSLSSENRNLYPEYINAVWGMLQMGWGGKAFFFYFKLKINCKVKWIPTHTYEKSVLSPKLGNPDSSFIP